MVTMIEGYLDDNCQPVSTVTSVPVAALPTAHGDYLATLGNLSVTTTAISDRYVYTQMWDCCGILLTEAVLELQFRWSGSTILERYVALSESHHRELVGGWNVDTSSLRLTGGCVGCSYISYRGIVGFSYQGVFDPTGTLYYNTHDNRLTGNGDGSWSCWWSISWRHWFPGWHYTGWCQ